MIVLSLLLSVLLLAWANGANDNFKAAATLYGSGRLSYGAARALATAAQLAGSLASVFLAGALLRSFGGKGLVPPSVVAEPAFLVAVGTGAALTVGVATRMGLPISTTHALVGGLAGAGFALAPQQLSWSALGSSFVLPLAVSPPLAILTAAVLYPLARRARQRLGIEADTCVCVGTMRIPVRVTAPGTATLCESGVPVTVARSADCQNLYDGQVLGVSAQTLVDRLHGISAFALGFARGLNDTPKVLGLLVAAGWAGGEPRLSLAGVALVMAAGGWWRAQRVAETLSHRITSLTHGQGLLSNGVASSLVIGASLLGSPVSTTHVATGALFGIGLWSDDADWRMVGRILLAWIATLPLAAAIAVCAARVIAGVAG